jgi:hypothetical protein
MSLEFQIVYALATLVAAVSILTTRHKVKL